MSKKTINIVSIILAVVIIGLINIDNIIKYFGGDFDDNINILVIDNTNEVYDSFSTIYNEYSKQLSTNTTLIKYTKTYEEAKEEIK